MKLLDYNAIESWVSLQNPEDPELPQDFCRYQLQDFTHISSDPKTLKLLLKYTKDVVGDGGILFLDSLKEVSATFLMVIFREVAISEIYLSSLETLDLACAKMLVRAVKVGGSSLIKFGFGFDLTKLHPEVIAELSTARHGWDSDGVFSIYDEEFYKDAAESLL
jgi:hypothetical protein